MELVNYYDIFCFHFSTKCGLAIPEVPAKLSVATLHWLFSRHLVGYLYKNLVLPFIKESLFFIIIQSQTRLKWQINYKKWVKVLRSSGLTWSPWAWQGGDWCSYRKLRGECSTGGQEWDGVRAWGRGPPATSRNPSTKTWPWPWASAPLLTGSAPPWCHPRTVCSYWRSSRAYDPD